MKKKLLLFALLFVGFITLTACSGQNLDGKYHRFFNPSNVKGVHVEKEVDLEISDKTLKYKGNVYSIDKEKNTITGKGNVIAYSFNNDVLSIDDETYVLDGSKKHEELLKLQKEKKNYEEKD